MQKIISRMKKNPSVKYWYNCWKNYRSKSISYNDIPWENHRSSFFQMSSQGKENQDKTIYYIDYEAGNAGFFAIYRGVLQLLYLADRMNWIPYIRIANSHYNDTDTDNVFEYFFEQPSHMTDEDVNKSFSVIRSNQSHMRWIDDIAQTKEKLIGGYETNDLMVEVLAKMSQKYIVVKRNIYNDIANDIEKTLGKKKTVGIHYRGNAYGVGFYGHPIKLEIEDYYNDIEKCLNEGYEQLFVATDEVEVLNKIIKKYGEIVVYYSDTFRSNNGIDVHEQHLDRQNNGFHLAYEVFRDMHTLASCDSLICGKSQVTISAHIEKICRGEHFEKHVILDKGLYTSNNEKKIKEYLMKTS